MRMVSKSAVDAVETKITANLAEGGERRVQLEPEVDGLLELAARALELGVAGLASGVELGELGGDRGDALARLLDLQLLGLVLGRGGGVLAVDRVAARLEVVAALLERLRRYGGESNAHSLTDTTLDIVAQLKSRGVVIALTVA